MAILGVLVAIVAVAGTYVGVVAVRVGRITHQNPLSVLHDVVTHGSGSSIDHSVQAGSPVTLALYGFGGDGHDGPFLTDSIMIVTIKPDPGGRAQVAELSVPRDWYVPIDLGNGQTVHERINTAYADAAEEVYPNRGDQYKGEFGPARLADDTLQRLLGIHIDHFIALDFHAFQYVVDAVGGVDVTVQTAFTDREYPAGECNNGTGNCGFTTVHFSAGPQHMDGARALAYARSRHGDDGEGSDFARGRRQQLVLAAVKSKVVGIGGISSLPSVLDALGGHVVTDLAVGDAESLYALVRDVDTASVEHVSIDDTNFLYECGYPTRCGAAYLFTRDPTYASVQHFVQNLVPTLASVGEKAPITVVDGSGTGGAAATRWATLLTQLGFTAKDGGTVATTVTTSVEAGPTQGSSTASWLTSFFATGPATPAPPGTVAASPGAVTLVIGAAEERAFNAAGVAG